MSRMKILNQAEQEIFDTPPQFNSVERKCFFEFTSSLLASANRLINPSHRIVFLVASGYFRATKKLFHSDQFHPQDISYVIHQLNININIDIRSITEIPKSTRQRHRKLILEYYGFDSFEQTTQNNIAEEILEMTRRHLKPKLIFWRCVDLFILRRIVLPSYHQLSELILKILNNHKKELIRLINQNLTLETRLVLDRLFAPEEAHKEGVRSPQYARYKLTLLKKPSHSTKPVAFLNR